MQTVRAILESDLAALNGIKHENTAPAIFLVYLYPTEILSKVPEECHRAGHGGSVGVKLGSNLFTIREYIGEVRERDTVVLSACQLELDVIFPSKEFSRARILEAMYSLLQIARIDFFFK